MELAIKNCLALCFFFIGIDAQDNNYYFGAPQARFIPNFQQQHANDYVTFNRHQPISYQQEASNNYFPAPRDLQTSDLPLHLQQTLPQYRFTPQQQAPSAFRAPPPPPPQNNYQPPQSNIYRNSENSHTQYRTEHIVPSTHRPNYSHLFKNHHDPQTETFLGEITIESPADLPPEFGNRPSPFKPAPFTQRQETSQHQQNWKERIPDNDVNADQKHNDLLVNNREILNHRTRIFAPDGNNYKRKQVKQYYVDTSGEVYGSKTMPTTTSVPATTLHRRFPFKILSTTTTTERNIDPLLEDLKDDNDDNTNHKNDVEIIVGPVTLPPDQFFTVAPKSTSEELEYEEDDEVDTTRVPDYEYKSSSENNVSSEEAEEGVDEDESNEDYSTQELAATEETIHKYANENTSNSTNSYDVLTMKPSTMVKDDNFKGFIDSTVIDSEPEVSTSAPTDVINVVTTKSVIQNTQVPQVSIANTLNSNDLEQLTTPSSIVEDSSETWVVVASVQTSRSVSGARYLPNSLIEQEIKTKLLTDDPEMTTISPNIAVTEEIPATISVKPNTSTESLIDKLDRVQSDLSGSLLSGINGNNITVITEGSANGTTMIDAEITTPTPKQYPTVVIKKFSADIRPTFKPKYQTRPSKAPKLNLDVPQSDEPLRLNPETKVTVSDISKFLPPGYKPKAEIEDAPKIIGDILVKATTSETPKLNIAGLKIQQIELSSLLPAGYKPPKSTTTTSTTTSAPKEEGTLPVEGIKSVDISKFLPPAYSPSSSAPTPTSTKAPSTAPDIKTTKDLFKGITQDDLAKFLPPGYKVPTTTVSTPASTTTKKSPLAGITLDDISAFLPPGFKPSTKAPSRTTTKAPLLKGVTFEDVSSLLPPGFRGTTEKPNPESALKGITMDDIAAFLPPGYKGRFSPKSTTSQPEVKSTETTTPSTTTTTSSAFKVVFPGRAIGLPQGTYRKSFNGRLTTPRSIPGEGSASVAPSNVGSGGGVPTPTIHKGWPTRATTEFTGWPTPSTTPISIEKLLEKAKNITFTMLNSTSSSSTTTSTTSTTTSTTTTTTTPKPTTPGYCIKECDLAGTIKLVGGAKWVPELLDRNTREWQILANEVQSQLEDVYSRSNVLNKWYKKIRIDGFSEGSVLVDYLVELNDLGRQVDTLEIKKLFHDSLEDVVSETVVPKVSAITNREPKSSSLDVSEEDQYQFEGKLSFGNFVVDPKYTDFIILPKQVYPTVGYADENVLLPQWAIAVIVIGLASLLFVIIFGVTVLVNRQKNAKKKQPTPLSDDMLNELNKNHMAGIDNYAADDLYNMEDVWNDRHPYDHKIPKKRSTGSIHDNSMANLYDSWRSEWNGYYYNAYYGNHPGSSHSGGGYGRRRSDYDTNF